MTPKEKAEELVTKYAALSIITLGCGADKGNPCIIENVMFKQSAKQCALIAVDEIINEWSNEGGRIAKQKYWQEVKQEIEKL